LDVKEMAVMNFSVASINETKFCEKFGDCYMQGAGSSAAVDSSLLASYTGLVGE
jgi:hypothetical protein